MQLTSSLVAPILLFLSTLAHAHFKIDYPAWRADSLSKDNSSISQWAYPCANIQPGQNASQPRTPWPLTGGSLVLDLHHPWTYVFVNLGFGAYVTNFNVSLNPNGGALVNETGNGTLCWNHLSLPSANILGLQVSDGTEASIQVVTVGSSGSALYNCADIVFTSNATLLPSSQCTNSTGISAQVVQTTSSQNSTSNSTSSGASSASTSSSKAASMVSGELSVLFAVLATVVALFTSSMAL